MSQLFFDSYAFFEITRGSEAYDRYVEHFTPVTTINNMYELHYHISLRYGEGTANDLYDVFREYVIEITDEDIKEASKFRAKNTAKKLSYIDALGYVMALRRGIKFLTGDKAFKGMPNVEFAR